jgi:hypothetical protein
MPTADPFTKLKEQVEDADREIKEAATKGDDELSAMVDEVRRKADSHAAELRVKSEAAADQAATHWDEVQRDWDEHIKRIRERITAKKAAVDADIAEQDAESAEADALDAIEFASAAIEEAEYAVLDAVKARKDADVMAAAT